MSGLNLFEGFAHIGNLGTEGVSISNKRIKSVFGLGVVGGEVLGLLGSITRGFPVRRRLSLRAAVGDI
jgi:hypothetical protein